MPARLRLRLRAWRVRFSRSVGYWWLEQRELSGSHHRSWRRPRVLTRRVCTWSGDRWYDLSDGVRRGGRRRRRGPARAWRFATRPFRRRQRRTGRGPLALARRGSHGLAIAVAATARSVVATPASGVEWVGGQVSRAAGASVTAAARGGRGLQGRLAGATGAARTGTSRGGRSVVTAVSTSAGALAAAGTATSRAVVATPASGVEWVGARLARATGAARSGTSRGGRSVGAALTTALGTTRTGAARGGRGLRGRLARATSAARAGTSRRGRSLGAGVAAAAGVLATAGATTTRSVLATPAAGVGWLGATGRRVAGAPAARWVAATAVLVVVGGAVFAGLRDGGTPGDPGGRSEAAQAGSPARQAAAGSGPGFTSPGIHLSVSPEGSGELGVVERVVTRRPVRVLPLAAPPPESDTGAPTSRLVGLSVVADGAAVPLDGVDQIAQQQDVRLPHAASTFELRYRVVGAEERSPLAPPGRATLSLRPAATAAVPTAPAVVEVRDAVVHTLVCLDAPRPQQLCGVDDEEGWHTEQVTASTSRVLALVDLPPT